MRFKDRCLFHVENEFKDIFSEFFPSSIGTPVISSLKFVVESNEEYAELDWLRRLYDVKVTKEIGPETSYSHHSYKSKDIDLSLTNTSFFQAL